VSIQVKICGLTTPEEAAACANAGAHAIGMVFYPPSPRHVEVDHARRIRDAIPAGVKTVGVFVDHPVEDIILTARKVGLDMIQLHGNETVFTIRVLEAEGLATIKVLRSTGLSLMTEATEYNIARSVLVEASKGALPGGNGASWKWSEAMGLGDKRPFILAGGINLFNLQQALNESHASAIDLSSSVELSPGRKDIGAVQAVIERARNFVPSYPTGICFP